VILAVPPTPGSLPGCFLNIQKKNYIYFFIVSVLIAVFELSEFASDRSGFCLILKPVVIALTWARMLCDRKRELQAGGKMESRLTDLGL
jgi:hypothetical protein